MISENIQHDVAKTCKVILFLERHDGAIKTIESVISLLPFFSQQGFKTFCLETFLNDNMQEVTQNIKVYLSKIYCATDSCKAIADRAELTNELIYKLITNNIVYCAMDKKPKNPNDFFESFSHARNEHMAQVIFEKCSLGYVLANVGFAHYQGIREELLKFGLLDNNVKGYYAPSIPAEKYTTKWDTFERNLRSVEEAYFEHKQDNIAVIDLLKDSALNITDIIIESYKKQVGFLNAVDQEPSTYTELYSLVEDLYDSLFGGYS